MGGGAAVVGGVLTLTHARTHTHARARTHTRSHAKGALLRAGVVAGGTSSPGRGSCVPSSERSPARGGAARSPEAPPLVRKVVGLTLTTDDQAGVDYLAKYAKQGGMDLSAIEVDEEKARAVDTTAILLATLESASFAEFALALMPPEAFTQPTPPSSQENLRSPSCSPSW